MIKLFDSETNSLLGEITEEQLGFIEEILEEESLADQDYYLTPDTLDFFEEEGADPRLVQMLRNALGDKEEMEVRWSRE